MNASEVRDRVRSDLGHKRENDYGWYFGDRLVEPPVQREYSETDGSTSVYWVVLMESEDGYHIIFDEADGMFGLASSGTVVGWHGDLMKTINGM